MQVSVCGNPQSGRVEQYFLRYSFDVAVGW